MDEDLRYELDDGAAWVVFDRHWTRGELRRFWRENGDPWLALVRSKIVALCVGELSDPAQVTEEGLDTLEYGVYTWFEQVCLKAVVDVAKLGEARGRRLWDTNGAATADRPTNS